MTDSLNIIRLEPVVDLNEASFKRVTRIRNGKIQRRKKISTRKGYKLNKTGRLVRIKASEKRNRKRGARLGKRKRMAKKSRMLRKRKRSLRIRKTRIRQRTTRRIRRR